MRLTVVGCSGSMPGAGTTDPGPILAGAAGAFGGPLTLAVPGPVTDLG